MTSSQASRAAQQLLEIIPFVMRAIAVEMQESPLTVVPAHLRLLGMLAHRSWTLTELADKSSVTPPTMSNTVTTLVDRGWVSRSRSTEDRRQVEIQITEKGRRILTEAYCHAERYLADVLAPLTPEERTKLTEGLGILRQVFEHTIPDKMPRPDCTDINNAA